mmetsp:Transcript_34621/g.80849  ORF Transcript_34621/g.80849 Transcript_34621/m.80849 type:complete len:229 (-) Transcript_34621:2043-2729(-)
MHTARLLAGLDAKGFKNICPSARTTFLHIVGDLLGASCILQRHGGLVLVGTRRRAVDKHQCLCSATQGVLHQARELVVSVRDRLGALGQSLYDISQGSQRLVDLNRFLLRVLIALSFLQPLRASQVAKQHLAIQLLLRLLVHAGDSDCQHQVGAGTLTVHGGGRHRSLGITPIQKGGEFLGAVAHLLNQVVYQHLSLLVLLDVEFALGCCRVSLAQQVHQVISIELQH